MPSVGLIPRCRLAGFKRLICILPYMGMWVYSESRNTHGWLEIQPIRAFLQNAHARYPPEDIKGTGPSFLLISFCDTYPTPRQFAKESCGADLKHVASPSDAVISLAADAVLSPADAIAFASSAAAYAEEPPTTTTATTTTITMHKCVTCGRVFTRPFTLQRHASRCRPKPFTCDVCHSSFGRKDNRSAQKNHAVRGSTATRTIGTETS